jgi:putative glutamine amidotransferase
MKMSNKKIGITLRTVNASNYDEQRDALSQDWPPFLEKINLTPIFIPNSLDNITEFLDKIEVDGFILSGGDNVGENPLRDNTEKKIIEFGMTHNLPIFGVCRGLQAINKFFNGSVVSCEPPANLKHLAKPHLIKIINKNLLSFLDKSIQVNSYHNNIITDESLGENLQEFAITDFDNSIEGIIHKSKPIIGVMWHPERTPNKENQLIVSKVFHDKDFWK